MELYALDITLVLWNLLAIFHLLLCIVAIVKLANDDSIKFKHKIAFLVAIIFIPIIGSLTFLKHHQKTKNQKV